MVEKRRPIWSSLDVSFSSPTTVDKEPKKRKPIRFSLDVSFSSPTTVDKEPSL